MNRSTMRFVLSLAATFAMIVAVGVARGEAEKPPAGGFLQISGVYPHLAVFSGSGEVGIGAVVPWVGKLWTITYPPHAPQGSSDKLYEIGPSLDVVVRPESVGGTHACRMIHRESNQLIIGPYFIDQRGKVRAADLGQLRGRMTAVMRHLIDPANKVYFFDMEGIIYEVDVHSLAVTRLFDRPVPGWHGKGAYTSQGRVVIANNGEYPVGKKKYQYLAGDEAKSPDDAGVLAEWDGRTWRIVERKQFTDVTGPGGIHGAPDDKSPLWAIGWDRRSVILKLLDAGTWHTFRLPKASHAYDPTHGWYTEWPRIRQVSTDRWLMDMHGMFYDFPGDFSAGRTGRLRPLASHLRYIPDFCEWKGRLVLAADDTSIMANPMAGQSQSNLWFGALADLARFGPRSGWGGPWSDDPVRADTPSDPFLIAGFDQRVVHLAHNADGEVRFTLETDAAGDGRWLPYRTIAVAARGYQFHVFPKDVAAPWVRVKADKDCRATAYFHVASARDASHDPEGFASLARVTERAAITGGLIRPAKHNRNLQYVAQSADATGATRDLGYYEVDVAPSTLRIERIAPAEKGDSPHLCEAPSGPFRQMGTVPFFRSDEVRKVAAVKRDFEVDEASVIMTQGNKRYRLPKGDPAYDRPLGLGWPRAIREVQSERYLMNVHGTFYERPRDSGLPLIKPVCSHGRQIVDFCTWRGLLAISGNREEKGEREKGKREKGKDGTGKEEESKGDRLPVFPDGHYFRSADGRTGLWFGKVDDLWRLGKPVGRGGPWHNTPVQAGAASDPYLMTGYDGKRIDMKHDATTAVRFTVEVDIDHRQWKPYQTFTVPAGQTVTHAFPAGFQAHWVRLKTDQPCRATAMLTYE